MAETWQEHFQLQKYNPFTGQFIAVAAMGKVVDRAKERLNFTDSKQYAASGGKSYGNVRLQHDPKRPVGNLIAPLEFDDANQLIRVHGQAVDPITKEMLQVGVLTGVSIGGEYVKRTLNPADGITDYVAKPNEISVVDRPCLAQATFEVVKNEAGETELRKFASEEDAKSLMEKLLNPTNEAEMVKTFAEMNTRIEDLTKAVNDFMAQKTVKVEADEKAAKSNFQTPTTEEVSKHMATPTVEELQKAHKSVMEHLASCKKAASDHKAEMHKAASDHEAAMHEACDKMAKAIGEPTVAMETTKADENKDLKKSDEKKDLKKDDTTMNKTDDEKIAEAVAKAVQTALGIQPVVKTEETLEQKIAKAVETAIGPYLAKSDPNQSRPRYIEKASTTLSDDDAAKLAKSAASGDRAAIAKMFSESAEQQRSQMQN
jgi:hypothetical protein